MKNAVKFWENAVKEVLNIKKLLFLMVMFLFVFSSVTYAQTFCEVNDVKQVLKKVLFLRFTDASSSPLILDEVRDLLVFYLGIGEGISSVDCSATGSRSNKKISDIIILGGNATNQIPKCSDGTEYGECSTFKPKYCYAGSLLHRCNYCSCPSDSSCTTSGKCETIENGSSWSYRKPINIANPGSALTDYQVLVTLDTASLISAGKMQADCDDIRSTNSDGTTLINHWLDSGCNSANTNIWVQVPSIPTAGATIFILYGNTEAATGSSFTSTFPKRYILASGTDTSSGAQNYDWFEVQSGATFTITDKIPQNITARKILIAGTVNGAGRGFDGAASVGSGQGPGAGSNKSGGAYGGAGGQGKLSAWGAGGTPGSTYGSASSQAIQMGSGGGASDSIQAPGGDGGGAVTFNSNEIVISGTVTMNGGMHSTGTNQNGGGGGGGILILSNRVNLAGTLSASGGNADDGTVRAGGAGGGGGGRIKIFSDESISDTSSKSVSGGTASTGGTNGGTYDPGEPGAAGTTHTGTFTSSEPTTSVGAEEQIP